jgi:P-type E1-E2 ATPase
LEVPLEDVVVGDDVVVRARDRVPVDEKVVPDSTYVDESMIAGEPVPVAKNQDCVGRTFHRWRNDKKLL